MKFATCNCPVGMKYHANNCPTQPGQEQNLPAWVWAWLRKERALIEGRG